MYPRCVIDGLRSLDPFTAGGRKLLSFIDAAMETKTFYFLFCVRQKVFCEMRSTDDATDDA